MVTHHDHGQCESGLLRFLTWKSKMDNVASPRESLNTRQNFNSFVVIVGRRLLTLIYNSLTVCLFVYCFVCQKIIQIK